IPAVPVAHHRDGLGVGRPHREVDAALDEVRAELLPQAEVCALVEEVGVLATAKLRPYVDRHETTGQPRLRSPARPSRSATRMRNLVDLVELADLVDILLVATLVYTAVVWIRRTQAGFGAL